MRKPFIPAVVLAGLVAVAGCSSTGSAGGGTSTGSGKTSSASPSAPAHSEDVAITACAADPTTGYVAAKVTVTNHSSKPSNYIINIAFESADGKTQIDTAPVVVNNLGPGQQTAQDANGLQPAQAGYVCKVADITRLAS